MAPASISIAHVVSQLLAFDAAEDEVFAGIGDAIACLIVHVGLLVDCYRHDATGVEAVGPINGTRREWNVTRGQSLSHPKYCLYVLMHTVCNNTRTVQ